MCACVVAWREEEPFTSCLPGDTGSGSGAHALRPHSTRGSFLRRRGRSRASRILVRATSPLPPSCRSGVASSRVPPVPAAGVSPQCDSQVVPVPLPLVTAAMAPPRPGPHSPAQGALDEPACGKAPLVVQGVTSLLEGAAAVTSRLTPSCLWWGNRGTGRATELKAASVASALPCTTLASRQTHCTPSETLPGRAATQSHHLETPRQPASLPRCAYHSETKSFVSVFLRQVLVTLTLCPGQALC